MQSNSKVCSSCEKEKPLDEYHKRTTSKDGYRHQCKECVYTKRKQLNICGIYKITSPSGKVYIGQSVDIKTRWSSYRTRDCPSQTILNKSFNKYGVKNHAFEIIEECLEEELNCRERYWQEFYEVTGRNGLNCVYVGEQKEYKKKEKTLKRKSIIKDGIKEVLDINTGVFLYSVLEASIYSKVPKSHLGDMLRGKAKNKTDLIRAEDYEKGLLPNTLFKPKIGKSRVKIKDGFEVIDYLTGDILGDTKTASKKSNISETVLRAYLKGVCTNKTNYIYKKDYESGLKPSEIFKGSMVENKVLNYITKEVYSSQKEASEKYGITYDFLRKWLDNVDKSPLPLIRLKDYDKNKIYNDLEIWK